MEEFAHISIDKTFELINQDKAKFVDIRDEQSYEQVYSMDGGFEAWRNSYPFVCSTENS